MRPPQQSPVDSAMASKSPVRLTPLDSATARNRAGPAGIATDQMRERAHRFLDWQNRQENPTRFTPTFQRALRQKEGFAEPQYHIKGGSDAEVSELSQHLPGYQPKDKR